MKCPMLAIALSGVAAKVAIHLPDCLKEECAWWAVQKKECAMITIALSLDLAQLSLESIANGLRK